MYFTIFLEWLGKGLERRAYQGESVVTEGNMEKINDKDDDYNISDLEFSDKVPIKIVNLPSGSGIDITNT